MWFPDALVTRALDVLGTTPAMLAEAGGTGFENVLRIAALLGAGMLLGAGLLRLGRRAGGTGQPTLDAGTGAVAGPVVRARSGSELAARRMCAAFLDWVAERSGEPEVWASFDQLIREQLSDHLCASRVRCYHVRAGSETLQTISQAGRNATGNGPSMRAGLLGHVATSGQEYLADDAGHGPLVHDLAAQDEQRWDWVWPVRGEAGTIGVVAVGNLHHGNALRGDLRLTLGQMITLCWRHVACLEQLDVVRRTDQASGVLTRNDFFTLAGHALADSYGANEPVVVVTLALEGLRRLDDRGCWRQRDALIEDLGRVLSRRVRSDDLVGRFADDRFVVLLRRLDSGLGRLIAEKLLDGARASVAALELESGRVGLRLGLAGSGFAQPGLEELLVAAFEAVDRARREGVTVATDVSLDAAREKQ